MKFSQTALAFLLSANRLRKVVGANEEFQECLKKGNTWEHCKGQVGKPLTSVTAFSSNTSDPILNPYNIEIFQDDEECTTAPANDNVMNALPIGISETVEVNNTCATVEEGEPNPGPGTGSNDCLSQDGWCDFPSANEPGLFATLWYKLTTGSDPGCINILAGDIDYQLAVYETEDPSDFSTFQDVQANDDSNPDPDAIFSPAIIDFCPADDSMYYIQLDGYNDTTGSGYLKTCPTGLTEIPSPEDVCLVTHEYTNYTCVNTTEAFPVPMSQCGLEVLPDIYNYSVTGSMGTMLAGEVGDQEIFTNNGDQFVSFDDITTGEVFEDEGLTCLPTYLDGEMVSHITVLYTATDELSEVELELKFNVNSHCSNEYKRDMSCDDCIGTPLYAPQVCKEEALVKGKGGSKSALKGKSQGKASLQKSYQGYGNGNQYGYNNQGYADEYAYGN